MGKLTRPPAPPPGEFPAFFQHISKTGISKSGGVTGFSLADWRREGSGAKHRKDQKNSKKPPAPYSDKSRLKNGWRAEADRLIGPYNYDDNPKTSTPRERPIDNPSTTIEESAHDAAQWLAIMFWQDADTEGIDAFILRNKGEILQNVFNPAYWEEATKSADLAQVYIPTNTNDLVNAPPAWFDATNLRTIASYGAPSAPYAIPSIDTGLPYPHPGYHGLNTGERFEDQYLATRYEKFRLPRPFRLIELPPVFASCVTNWYVTVDNFPSEAQFRAWHQTVFQHPDDPELDHNIEPTESSRMYRWLRKLPPYDNNPWTGHQERHYLVDCNLGAAYYHAELGVCTEFTIKTMPMAALGRYYNNSRDIAVQTTTASRIWMARRPFAGDEIPGYSTDNQANSYIRQGDYPGTLIGHIKNFNRTTSLAHIYRHTNTMRYGKISGSITAIAHHTSTQTPIPINPEYLGDPNGTPSGYTFDEKTGEHHNYDRLFGTVTAVILGDGILWQHPGAYTPEEFAAIWFLPPAEPT